MENLLALLDKIQQISPLPFFSKEIIVVQNAGMQHWLNMSLATARGISMNIDYALPAQYLWKLVRSLASDEMVPEQSPYSREVLTWRIHQLLASDFVLNCGDFYEVNRYWQGEIDSENGDEQAQLKRYQLAQQLADLYEQYLIFRPDWIDLWSRTELSDSCGKNLTGVEQVDAKETAVWQGKLWQLLTKQLAYNPKELMANALANIEKKQHLLPPRLSFFGINAMAPMWLDFIQGLSAHIEVHFFHLNPCYDYWGDIESEKQAFKKINQWTQGFDQPELIIGNPLLANLGQQGREFIALLQDHSTIDIDAFELSESDRGVSADVESDKIPSRLLLHKIQSDILTLRDAKQAPQLPENTDAQQTDHSITITSCHSALREVQGLHDWLLHQFNQDGDLTPKDVIVMCPQIEHYAPYIDAVFARGWQELDDNIPPLPCSIADRVSKDAEPNISAFLEVLKLPDSRFQVSELLALLRLPAMANKFNLALEEIDKITVWLEQASIHWGIDQNHKEQLLNTCGLTNAFTWQQGLSRLLRGFAFGDSSAVVGEQLLLPSVEGSDGELLGKLMLIIERLQQYSRLLTTKRNANQWQLFLLSLVDELFELEGERCFDDLSAAIKALSENCEQAHYQEKLPLSIVSDFLHNYFSQPEPGRQFMIGQVTFCSMVPMRSIPFKIVAILGLNDGEFPRQRQPLGFDLLANSKARLGDRSRRGDDRYLFLEALISARKALYLSYQGRNIKNNTTRQPSIVLKEFIDYLSLGYGWRHLLDNTVHAIEDNVDNNSEKKSEQSTLLTRELSMQPFSLLNYQGHYPSFDAKWLALAKQQETDAKESQPLVVVNDGQSGNSANKNDESSKISDKKPSNEMIIDADELIRFFQHPAKAFARHQLKLNLTFNDIDLDDVEPFAINSLESYQLRQSLLHAYLQPPKSHLDEVSAQSEEQTAKLAQQQVAEVLTMARLSGKFPDLPTTEAVFTGWQGDSEQFSQLINENDAANPELIATQYTLELSAEPQAEHTKVIIKVRLPIKAQQLVFYRSSSAKAKDKFSHYLHQLLLQVIQDSHASDESQGSCQSHQCENITAICAVNSHSGFYFDTKSQKSSQLMVSDIDDAKGKLQQLVLLYLQGQQQALLLNCELGENVVKGVGRSKTFSQTDFERFWQGANSFQPFGDDAYINYFWPKCPELSDTHDLLTQVYQPMLAAVQPLKKTKATSKG